MPNKARSLLGEEKCRMTDWWITDYKYSEIRTWSTNKAQLFSTTEQATVMLNLSQLCRLALLLCSLWSVIRPVGSKFENGPTVLPSNKACTHTQATICPLHPHACTPPPANHHALKLLCSCFQAIVAVCSWSSYACERGITVRVLSCLRRHNGTLIHNLLWAISQ